MLEWVQPSVQTTCRSSLKSNSIFGWALIASFSTITVSLTITRLPVFAGPMRSTYCLVLLLKIVADVPFTKVAELSRKPHGSRAVIQMSLDPVFTRSDKAFHWSVRAPLVCRHVITPLDMFRFVVDVPGQLRDCVFTPLSGHHARSIIESSTSLGLFTG